MDAYKPHPTVQALRDEVLAKIGISDVESRYEPAPEVSRLRAEVEDERYSAFSQGGMNAEDQLSQRWVIPVGITEQKPVMAVDAEAMERAEQLFGPNKRERRNGSRDSVRDTIITLMKSNLFI